MACRGHKPPKGPFENWVPDMKFSLQLGEGPIETSKKWPVEQSIPIFYISVGSWMILVVLWWCSGAGWYQPKPPGSAQVEGGGFPRGGSWSVRLGICKPDRELLGLLYVTSYIANTHLCYMLTYVFICPPGLGRRHVHIMPGPVFVLTAVTSV